MFAGKDARGGRPPARIFSAGLTVAVMIGWLLSTALPAGAAHPSGAKLKWLPYHESEAESQVVTAAGVEQPEAPGDQVRQVQATAIDNPFNDPFGDAKASRLGTTAAPILSQAPSRGQLQAALQPPSPGNPPQAVEPAEPARLSPKVAYQAPRSNPPRGEKKVDFSCRSLEDLSSIDELTNSIAVPKDLKDYKVRIDKLGCPLGAGELPDRITTGWAPTTFHWQASALCHKPLYFAQSHVERYGHATGPFSQPFVSAAMFFATVPLLPYEMGLNPPYECMYSLGYYRPGSCAPYHIDPFPLSIRAGLIQTGAVLGAVYIIP